MLHERSTSAEETLNDEFALVVIELFAKHAKTPVEDPSESALIVNEPKARICRQQVIHRRPESYSSPEPTFLIFAVRR